MANKFALKFDVSKTEAVAERLRGLTAEQITKTTVPALNQVLDRTYDLARERITVGINLSDDYLRRKFKVVRATEARPTGEITAFGGSVNQTPLSRYNGQMVLVPKKNPNRTRYKGGQSRLGIPWDKKQGGVQVEVTRGNTTTLEHAFFQPLRGGNGLGVFTRSKTGVKRHRYGPAVYQLFRYQAERIEGDVLDDMDATIAAAAAKALQDALE